MKTILLSFTFMVILLNPLQSQTVNLDPQFGAGGVASITFVSDNLDEQPWDIALLPNGKILLLGYSYETYENKFPWIARLKANGELDNDFGTSGVSIIDTEGYYADLRGIHVQPDGKILINGYMDGRLAIYRTDSLGFMDPSFGDGGLSIIGFCSMDAAEDIALSKSGKIAAVGYSCEFNARFLIAMFNPDGSLNLNFNETGYFVSEYGEPFRNLTSVEFQSDQKIVAAGQCGTVNMDDIIYVVRIDTTGNLDQEFGTSGEFSYTMDWDTDLTDMAIQEDGKILLCFNKILRLNANGTVDNSFGNNGIVETKVNDDYIQIRCVELQEDGKIVVAGSINQFVTDGYYNNIIIARYDESGILDNSFGDNGIIVAPISKIDVTPRSMVLQPDNKILFTGVQYNDDLDQRKVLLARFLPHVAVGIESKQPAKSGIIVYPNPADDYIYLENLYHGSESLTWQIYDLEGRKIINGRINSDPLTIYIGNLNPSVYLLNVTDNEYKLIRNFRIIVQ